MTIPSYMKISQGGADFVSVWVTCNLLLRYLLQPDSQVEVEVEVEEEVAGISFLMRLSGMRHFPQPKYRKWYLSVQKWNLLQTCETKKINLKKSKCCRASFIKSDFISNNSTFQRKVKLYLLWHIMRVSKITLLCKYIGGWSGSHWYVCENVPRKGKKLYKAKKTVENHQHFKQVQKWQSTTSENTAHVESAPRNALKIWTAVKCVIWDAAKSSSDLKVRGSELLIKRKDEHKSRPIHRMTDVGGE